MKADKVKGLDPAADLRVGSAKIIRRRCSEMLALAEAAAEPGASEAQHDMRIAAKRLRYVLEIVGRCFGAEAEVAQVAAKEVQSVLGEIHDCDVMLPRISAEIERLRSEDVGSVLRDAADETEPDPAPAARAPHRTAYRGLELLSVHFAARRALLHRRFLAMLGSQRETGVWTALDRML